MSEFERNYLTALRLHGETGLPVDRLAARQLGATAVSLSIEILDLAKIHEVALKTIIASGPTTLGKKAATERAALFFKEALLPLENEHGRVRDAAAEITGESADSGRPADKDPVIPVSKGGLGTKQGELVGKVPLAEIDTSDEFLAKYPVLQHELRLLSRRLLSVQEEERKQISRELHDLIAETLTGINLQLALFESRAISDAEDFHEKIAQTQKLIEKSVETVHRFARDLRPAALDDLGLIPALQSHLKDFMRDTGIRVALTSFAGVEKLGNESRTALYRVAQEALRNVAQHAGASRAEVKILQAGEMVRMEIHDDGKGFQVDVDAFFGERSKRLGLLGMKERVEMVDGRFWVESAPGKETSVFAEIPLQDPDTPTSSETETPP